MARTSRHATIREAGHGRLLRTRARICLVLSLALVPFVGLWADVVHLKNGREIEGSVAPAAQEGSIEVRTGEGTVVVLKQSEVERIERRPSPLEEFESRQAALAAGDIEGLELLLVFARDKRLGSKVRLVARKILENDPNHPLARKELGYVVFENRWANETELRRRKDLVRFREEWMTVADRDRRLAEEARKEVEDLLSLVDSENAYLQEFSVRKVLARRDPAALDLFVSRLRDRNESVRLVAARALSNFPVQGAGDAASRERALRLHEAILAEDSPSVRAILLATSARFHPAESFRLALDCVTRSPEPALRGKAADVLYHALRKSAVPTLVRALESGDPAKPREEVRAVLRRVFGLDLGPSAAAWLRYWREHEAEYVDE